MWTKSTPFAAPGTKIDQEEGRIVTPKFDENGLVPVITQDADNGEVLMLAYMNAEALARTIETRQGWYWSRSRKGFWRKGETSGHTQEVVSLALDCDQDAVLMKVRQIGPACHTERRSCFYREIQRNDNGTLTLIFTNHSNS